MSADIKVLDVESEDPSDGAHQPGDDTRLYLPRSPPRGRPSPTYDLPDPDEDPSGNG